MRGPVLALALVATLGAAPAGSPPPAAPALAPAQAGNVRFAIDFNLSAAQIAQNCAARIADAKAAQTAILRVPKASRTFASVVLPLENLGADLNDRLAAETFLAVTSPSKAVRDASIACSNDVGAFTNELGADPGLYAALQDAQQSATARDDYDRKLLSLGLVGLKRSGAGLPAAQRAEFVKLSNRLNELGNSFQANLGEDETTIEVSAAELEGSPADVRSGYKQAADGKFVVPVNESTVSLFMDNVRNPDARKRFYFAYDNRAAAKNLPILQEALGIRYRLAQLLGYPSWDAYQLADRMPQTPQRLEAFLGDLTQRLQPLSDADLARLKSVKAAETHTPSATLDPWDLSYYEQRLLQTRYAVDQNAIRQYFPVQHTIDAVLG
ncbi:MAG TPA: M3 family metallopeptidase, partial [Candidatus Baltobacteraceae bacterium]|nr:M3 family metallopeptidase [Candidatus Baltobacteraceae bacterium]